jgi:hypothetical protein
MKKYRRRGRYMDSGSKTAHANAILLTEAGAGPKKL